MQQHRPHIGGGRRSDKSNHAERRTGVLYSRAAQQGRAAGVLESDLVATATGAPGAGLGLGLRWFHAWMSAMAAGRRQQGQGHCPEVDITSKRAGRQAADGRSGRCGTKPQSAAGSNAGRA